MKILFIHQNFPGQYLHLARHLGSLGLHEIVFITQREDADLPGVRKIVYKPARKVTKGLHHYLLETESGVLNAQNVARVALELKGSGFVPDVVLGHNGWGELWYIKEVFPTAPLVGYFEFFYKLHGADVGFEPGLPLIFDTGPRIRTKNIGNLLALNAVDFGHCPTQWQRSLYPSEYQSKLHVMHEGINTDVARPDSSARLTLEDGRLELSPDNEVLTYVARNLEPYRGFPSFMRSLPAILRARPRAHVLIVGSDGVSYGTPAAAGRPYRELMLEELGYSIDLSRVHFLGRVAYSVYLKVLQVSTAHVYLTYPFVLSWSMLEAMSAECLVIGSRTQPVEEVIRDGENGLLVDIFSPAAIADAAIGALADREQFRAVRQGARRTILQRYDLQRVCLPRQLQLLELAVAMHRP